ncbi:MAG: dihydrolipoamide acetyltransferase family protein [bacterium]|nr:dihydrolipoamide acetyltransferase family protein [bacterium]
MATQVIMPQLGESVVEGTVSRWLKREGETVQAFEPLLEVSTDKVDTEVPAAASGVVLKIIVREGQTVERGTLLAWIGEPGEVTDDHAPPVRGHGDHHAADTPIPAAVSQMTAPQAAYTGHVTPVVARMAAQHQLDLAQIAGSGRDGRVTKKDVEAYLAAQGQPAARTPSAYAADLPPWERPGSGDLFKSTLEDQTPDEMTAHASPNQRVHPVEPIPQVSEGELVALTPMRRAIADHMVTSRRTSPHVTTVFEIDMTAALHHRATHRAAFSQQGVNLTLTAYFVMAAVDGLRAVPALNARWTDDGIYLLRPIHIGMAVALDHGLIVPVIKHAGDLNLLGTARTVNDLAARARTKALKPDEVQGGTFSITNHGVSGSLFATPIINQPQVGIMGVGMMEKRVKVIDDMIAIRPCAYVSLTFDHRVIDGAAGDSFLLSVKNRLENWT